MAGNRISSDGRKPIILQPRDELIMALVAEFRLLSRPQLQALLDFPCVTRINIRLKKLYDHSYLARRFLPTIMGKPLALYYLGPKGIINIAQNDGLDPSSLEKGRKRIGGHKDLFLSHQLFLNEVRIAFTLAIRAQRGMSLDEWIKERDCLIEFRASQGKIAALRPDGCLRLSYQKRFYSFFIEVDCSTMTRGRLRSKARAYLDYARSGHSLSDFGFQFFRVLIITKTRERLYSLKATIEELSDRIFYFAVRDQICQGSAFDQVWHRAGRPGLFYLLEN